MRRTLRRAGRAVRAVGTFGVVVGALSVIGLPATLACGLPVYVAPVVGALILEVIH